LYVGEFKTYCVNYEDYGFEGSVKVTSTCDAKLKKNISFQFDTNSPKCLEFGGVKVGYDTICLRVCEITTNRCSDFRLIVKVLPTKLRAVFRDTVYKDSSAIYCIKTTSFQTKPKTFVNNCPSGNDVAFTLDKGKVCVTYKGLKPGVDTACIEICDSLGNCVYVDMQIWVVTFLDPPVAVDDIDTTFLNKMLIINEMANDKINGKLMEMELISKPRFGSVTMSPDMKVQYFVKDEVNCRQIDSFAYRICNQDGCDTAMIKVYIRCPKVVVYTGFSPNEDNENDVFTVTDIDLYPNNEVNVYNRWGNEVFFKRGYKNEWKGTWNGKELPDGTYYYVIKLNDDEHTVLSGYLQLHR
jgi:gliding motility-associated-like protein